MNAPGVLVVLRGNSGSGKSTVARRLQQHVSEGECLVVSQDKVRREMLREPDVRGAANIELVELSAEAVATAVLHRVAGDSGEEMDATVPRAN